MTLTPDHYLDACGLLCPEPVMLLHRSMRAAADGDLVKVQATDPATLRDVPKFCHFLGHELVKQHLDGDMLIFWIRKVAK